MPDFRQTIKNHMIKKLISGIFLAFCSLYVMCLITPAYATHDTNSNAYQVMCGASEAIFEGLEENYGEKIVEQGVDTDEHILVVVTASLKRTWSFLMTPKGKPKTFCVILTGTKWDQEKESSTGVAHDGSIITIIFDSHGKWQLLFFNKTTNSITNITTGYGWERLIDLRTITN